MTAATLGSIMRLLLTVLMVGLWLHLHPGPSQTHYCEESGSPSEELEGADAVFLGRAVSVSYVERVYGEETYIESVITKFKVTTVWKGPMSETIYINSGGSYGIGFAEGEEYIVYAYHAPRRTGLATGLCTRTTPLSRAMEDLVGLGEGTSPLQPAATATPQPTSTPVPQPADTPAPQPTNTPVPRPANTPTPQPTATPTPQPTNTPTPEAATGPAPRPTPPPTPEATETSGGCSRSQDAIDISAAGVLAGLAWFGVRKRRSESA